MSEVLGPFEEDIDFSKMLGEEWDELVYSVAFIS